MLNFGNKEFRNLQEQVLKNMDDIQFILEQEGVLNQFGIKVVGQETTIEALPTVADYKTAHVDWAYGDTYAIGAQEPYTLYVLTRANGTHPDDYWFNIGEFPAPGPQGEQGPVGPTPNIRVGSDVITTAPGTDAQVVVTRSGLDTSPKIHFSFGIPRGENGIQGPQGPRGPQGPQGLQGIPGVQGDPGYLFTTIGQVDKETDLPDPLTVGRNSAMYVGTAAPYNVYVIMGQGSNLEWFNLGTVSTQIIPTYIFSDTYAESGTLNSDTLQEIINNQNAHAIRIGANVLYYITPGYYSSSGRNTFNFVNVNLTTGAWTLTSQVVSGGTKLYKHYLSNFNPSFGPLTLYSTSPTPITMENRMVELPKRFNPYSTENVLQLVLSYSSSTGDIYVRLYLIKQNTESQFILKQVYGPMAGTKESGEKIITSFTDTVTPL